MSGNAIVKKDKIMPDKSQEKLTKQDYVYLANYAASIKKFQEKFGLGDGKGLNTINGARFHGANDVGIYLSAYKKAFELIAESAKPADGVYMLAEMKENPIFPAPLPNEEGKKDLKDVELAGGEARKPYALARDHAMKNLKAYFQGNQGLDTRIHNTPPEEINEGIRAARLEINEATMIDKLDAWQKRTAVPQIQQDQSLSRR